MAEPIVTGLGVIKEAIIDEPAATQCAASLTGGGVQQSVTSKVVFFIIINGLVELLIFRPAV